MSQANLKRPIRQTYTVQHLNGQGYVVYDPEGVRVSEPVRNKVYAVERRDKLQAVLDGKTKRQDRPCMCCGTTFPSVGIHNRMCDPCRRRPDVDISPNSIARGNRR